MEDYSISDLPGEPKDRKLVERPKDALLLELALAHVLRLTSWPIGRGWMGAIVRMSGSQKNEGFGRNRGSRGGWMGGGWRVGV